MRKERASSLTSSTFSSSQPVPSGPFQAGSYSMMPRSARRATLTETIPGILDRLLSMELTHAPHVLEKRVEGGTTRSDKGVEVAFAGGR